MGCLSSKEEVNTAKYAVGAGSGSSMSREAADAVALVTGTNAYSSWVEIQVSCKNLRTADTFSKSDPMVVLFQQQTSGWREIARTEVISNNESPVFAKRLRMLFNFESVQNCRLEIVDVDRAHNPDTVDVKNCSSLGQVEFKLSDVLTASGRSLTLKVLKTTRPSTVTLVAEEMSGAREVLTIKMAASGLTNIETLSKSDPFLEISRVNEGGQWLPVFRTEAVSNNLNPTWREFSIKATQLNNGDPHRVLRLRVFDFEDNGRHRLLGEVETSALKLQQLSVEGSPMVLSNPKVQGKSCGALRVLSFSAVIRPTFLDYLNAGAEISFIVGVDYTGSNGDPRQPNTLHYLHPGGALTAYEQAISGVGRVLELYDHDKIFQCYGFGAKPNDNSSPVQHCLPMGPQHGSCFGISGVLQAYRQTLTMVQLAGPTLFTPLLKQAASVASQYVPGGPLRYHVLMIMTDGCIMDMQDTIDCLVASSGLPLSILIVGIGNAPELSNMEVLDADKKKLTDRTGRQAVRDIVQYMQFSKYNGDGIALATELLAELPGQFLQWVRLNNIPLPAAPASAAPPSAPTI